MRHFSIKSLKRIVHVSNVFAYVLALSFKNSDKTRIRHITAFQKLEGVFFWFQRKFIKLSTVFHTVVPLVSRTYSWFLQRYLGLILRLFTRFDAFQEQCLCNIRSNAVIPVLKVQMFRAKVLVKGFLASAFHVQPLLIWLQLLL